jgi:hypothetical protein
LISTNPAFGQKVTSRYAKNYNLAALKTYEFKIVERESSDPLASDTLLDDTIKKALEDELHANAYHPAPAGSPDFLISYRVTTRNPSGRLGVTRMSYIRATLVVDFIDARENKLVWRGTVSEFVGADTFDQEQAEDKSKRAAKLLLERLRHDISGL